MGLGVPGGLAGEAAGPVAPASELTAVTRFRRSAFLFFRLEDSGLLDLGRLLRGVVPALTAGTDIRAISVLTGEERSLQASDLEAIAGIPADGWVEIEDAEALLGLAEAGVLITDAPGARLAELRRREERLAESGWGGRAALFHFLDADRDAVELPEELGAVPMRDIQDALAEILSERGPPPGHFHAAVDGPATELPLVEPRRPFYETLHRRRTTRSFDESSRVSLEQLSVVLYETFGCHGLTRFTPKLVTLRKTSPSGGGLHPVECYPLVVDVEDVEPGLYHYDATSHALRQVAAIGRESARDLIVEFTAGQSYLRSAHVLVVMAARFARSFWKYQEDNRAYAVLLMDAGHLSQTLYLVCTELGLGAFVTAAINASSIERSFGLDGLAEGVLAVCGFGIPAQDRPSLEPEPIPYRPRETLL